MDSIALELFQYGIEQCVMEYHQACVDCEIGLVSALEIYETACLIGSYETITEGASTEHLQSVQEGAATDLLKKIVELFKRAVQKIKEIGKRIMEKLKTLYDHIKEKIKKFTPGEFITKSWPNGFDFNLEHGTSEFAKFGTVAADLTTELMEKCLQYANIARNGDEEKVANWMKSNENLIKHDPDVRSWYNEKIKTKFNDKDSAVKDWIEEIFEYKQYGPDYKISANKMMAAVNDLLKADSSARMISITSDAITSTEEILSDTGRKIESIGNASTKTSKYAPTIQYLGSLLIRYAEFGVMTMTQASSFALSKTDAEINAFVKMGLLKRRAA